MASVAISLARHKYKLILVSGLGTGAAALSVLYATSGEEEESESSFTGPATADLTAGEGIQDSEKVENTTKDTQGQTDVSKDLTHQLSTVISQITESGNMDADDEAEEGEEDLEEPEETEDQSGLSGGGCDPKQSSCSFYQFWKRWTIKKDDLTQWENHILKNVVKFGHWSSMSDDQKQQISEAFRNVWPKSRKPRQTKIKAFMHACYKHLKEPAKYSKSQEDVVRDIGKWCLSVPVEVKTKPSQPNSTLP